MNIFTKLINLKNLFKSSQPMLKKRMVVLNLHKLENTNSVSSDAGSRYRNVFDSDKLI